MLLCTYMYFFCLQDMLDSVQSWVSDAEKRMSETEAMPIANNLEGVEEQLAAHEVGKLKFKLCIVTYTNKFIYCGSSFL